MAGRLSSKVVIVTGGSTGTGRAVAGRVVAEDGGVNATAPLPGVGAGDWQADLEQNLTSVFYCLRYQIPAITRTAGGGSIINNASAGGVRGIPGLAPYVAAKHGVVGLTRSAALEGASRGVSDEAAFITGAALAIDGGATA